MDLGIKTVKVLSRFTDLNDANLKRYTRAKNDVDFLVQKVITPFKKGLQVASGYSDEYRPTRTVEQDIDCGPYKFVVKTIPTKKRTPDSDVLKRLHNFLEERYDDAREISIEGVCNVEGIGYVIRVDHVLDRIARWKKVYPGIKTEVTYPELEDRIRKVSVPFNLQYNEPTLETAKIYLRADQVKNTLEETLINPFEDAAKELTGYTSSNPPDKTCREWIPMNKFLSMVRTVPGFSAKYTIVLNKIRKDLNDIKIEDEDHERELQYYRPTGVVGERGIYVSIKRVRNKIAQVTLDYKKPKITQSIFSYPYVG